MCTCFAVILVCVLSSLLLIFSFYFLVSVISGPLGTALIHEMNHHPTDIRHFRLEMESHEMSL
jgi:hypothetical protein